MATLRPLFNNFISLLLLFLHLGCFIFNTSNHHNSRKREFSPQSLHSSPSPSRLKLNPRKAISSSWSFFKRIFSSSTPTPQTHPNPTIRSPCSSTRSLRHSSIFSVIPNDTFVSDFPRKRHHWSFSESDISSDQRFFPLRNDIYPCPICGEIFQRPNILEQHQSIKHAISELIDGDSGKNIVSIIFRTGWTNHTRSPNIHRILKIHNIPTILTRFEEYREYVKSKAARNSAVRRRDERCIADGNELLRFYCATFSCDLGKNGDSSICNQQFCSVCGIIKSGFSPKMDGISTLSTSWKAHVAIPDDIEEEFSFMHVKRAMVVCRVIAGRVGCEPDVVDKVDPGYDSLVGRASGFQTRLEEEDELLVYNPRAVLPCFVIVYTA